MQFLPIALIALGFAPFIVAHLTQISGQDHLSHFPVTLICIGYLAYSSYRERDELQQASPRLRWVGITLAVISLLFLLGATATRSSWLGMVATIFGLGATIDLAGGKRWRSALRPAWLMSFALLQPPLGTDRSIIITLQEIASKMAGSWLDVQGIINRVTGVVVRTPESDYLVEEACSGVNSLFASVTLAFFWVLFSKYRVIRSVVFLGSVVGWVILINAFRVWLIVYADRKFQVDLTSEPQHTALGVGMFAIVIGLAASTDRFLQFVLPAKWNDTPKLEKTQRAKADLSIKRPWINTLATISLLTFVTGAIGFYRPVSAAIAQGVIADKSIVPDIPLNSLPKEFGPWRLDSSKRIDRSPSDAFGLVSFAWFYTNGDVQSVISLDGPYDSWHDLGYCYGATGWELRDSRNIDLATQAQLAPMSCVELNLYKGDGERSVVMFTSFDRRGQVIDPPAAHGTALRNLINRFGASGALATEDGSPAQPPVFQVQLRSQTDFELAPEDRASLDQLYDFACRKLSAQMFALRSAEDSAFSEAAGATP